MLFQFVKNRRFFRNIFPIIFLHYCFYLIYYSCKGIEMTYQDYIIKEPVAQGEVKGFFAQHGKFSAGSGKKYSVAELQGTYICALIDCEAVQVKSFDDPNVLVPTFKWIFESTEVRDNDGQPFRLITYTKTYYGNDKAKLTILLDGMVGRMTSQQFQDLDMDVLKAKQWKVTVGIRQKMNSELFNVIQTVKPV